MPNHRSSAPSPRHPLLPLTPFRSQRALEQLKASIWRDLTPISVESTRPSARLIPLREALRAKRFSTPVGNTWGKLFDQRWSRLVLPRREHARWLHWHEDGEATLYIDGTPFYGFDVAHRCCEIPPGAAEVWIESIAVQAAIWHPDARGLSADGNQFRGAMIGRRDDEAWGAYHDLLCLHDVMIEERARLFPELGRELRPMLTQPALTGVPPFYRRLLRVLDEAVDAFDAGDVSALRRRLADGYRELRATKPLVRATLTGHSHLDLVWLWPERIGEVKATHTFANVSYLFGRYPELRFTYSQPASYEAVARRAPRLFAAVQRHVAERRWQPTGALYVEGDSQMVCGEGLVRSFTYGQAAFARLTGARSRLLWLPDLFGFNGCLPQLMRLAGVGSFFTTKLQWNAVHRFPHSSFVWQGIDGSEVLAHIPQEAGFNNGLTAAELRACATGHPQSDVHPETLCPSGYGDGGGGPTDEICERARRLSGVGDLPAASWDLPEAFFDRLARRRRHLPVHHGELYLEAHRGTFTTRRPLKEAFRALERALQLREAVACAQGVVPDLAAAWQRMIFAQFHDFIPGSSIPEVYTEGIPELERIARTLQAASARALADEKGEACMFNPLPVARRVMVDGCHLELPPASGVRIREATRLPPPDPVIANRRTLGNGLVRLRLDRHGHIAELTFNGHSIALRDRAGSLVLYPDQPCHHPAWEIDHAALALGQTATAPATIAHEHNALVVRRRVGRASEATLRYWLEPGQTALRLAIEVDWREPDTLLKLHFPTDYRGRDVRCGLPFGTLRRPQQASDPQVAAMWEFPASRHVSVADDAENDGLTLIAESHYGFSCRDGNLAVSLLRSPVHVGADQYITAYPPRLRRTRPARHTDIGRHTMRFALAPYALNAPRSAQPAFLAEALFTPVLHYRGKPCATPFLGIVGADTLVPSWIQPWQRDRHVLRLHEVAGARGEAELLLAAGWRAEKVNLFGERLAPPLRQGRCPFNPFEIISVLISRP